ncbi:MAG: dephospho-CoA kinase [Flavobacteriales bacterium]|nr:dephospho-CoA kinase [Candidatus Arcticimaribacter sp.]|tara:strand:+ start:3246 stop:3833 length:588 start_codon:yes stop_codon:yes gene_type:complete
MPRIVGLTGGIGSGKSRIAGRFAELGVPCYIADDRAKELMNSSTSLRNAILENFGPQSYADDKLNREFISNLVFKDMDRLVLLNALVHPAVAQDFSEWISEQNSSYVIKEAAILFESGGAEQCDEVILVTAPMETRIERVLARDHSTVDAIKSRMSKQWADEKKIPLADYHIENIKWEDTLTKIDVLHQKLLQNL